MEVREPSSSTLYSDASFAIPIEDTTSRVLRVCSPQEYTSNAVISVFESTSISPQVVASVISVAKSRVITTSVELPLNLDLGSIVTVDMAIDSMYTRTLGGAPVFTFSAQITRVYVPEV